jgi:hypothetical protein
VSPLRGSRFMFGILSWVITHGYMPSPLRGYFASTASAVCRDSLALSNAGHP